MSSQSDSEYEEEDLLVYAEIDENIDVSNCQSVHVLGIDSAKPILQLDDNYFQGKYVQAMGTYMFFEADEEAKTTDPLFDPLPKKNLKYLNKTSKVINFNRVYLNHKGMEEDTNMSDKSATKQDNKEEIEEFHTLEDVLAKFENTFREPNTREPDTEMKEIFDFIEPSTAEKSDISILDI